MHKFLPTRKGLVPKRMVVAGDKIKEIPDETRIWVKGHIITQQHGSPEQSEQGRQQLPTQWVVVFHVDRDVEIDDPFERPKDEKFQNKQKNTR